jgi:hypothetical protein
MQQSRPPIPVPPAHHANTPLAPNAPPPPRRMAAARSIEDCNKDSSVRSAVCPYVNLQFTTPVLSASTAGSLTASQPDAQERTSRRTQPALVVGSGWQLASPAADATRTRQLRIHIHDRRPARGWGWGSIFRAERKRERGERGERERKRELELELEPELELRDTHLALGVWGQATPSSVTDDRCGMRGRGWPITARPVLFRLRSKYCKKGRTVEGTGHTGHTGH